MILPSLPHFNLDDLEDDTVQTPHSDVIVVPSAAGFVPILTIFGQVKRTTLITGVLIEGQQINPPFNVSLDAVDWVIVQGQSQLMFPILINNTNVFGTQFDAAGYMGSNNRSPVWMPTLIKLDNPQSLTVAVQNQSTVPLRCSAQLCVILQRSLERKAGTW